MINFPDGFAWGVATASYQIEGAVAEDGRGPSIWDTFTHTPGTVSDGSVGDVACDHYHRYAEDLDLLSSLNATHYRFSVAWSRVQPDGSGSLNRAGLDFYSRLVDGLLDRGIVPWLTLYHWDLPQALEDAGGWPGRDTALRFADYAAATYQHLGDRVRHWTTLNEPWCSAFLGYGNGVHAPGRQDPVAALRASHHLLLGHGLAVQRLRDAGLGGDQQVGLTLNLWPVAAVTDQPDDLDAARQVDGISNRWFLDPVLAGSYPRDVIDDLAPITDHSYLRDGDERTIAQPLDFLGINYYLPTFVRRRRTEDGPPGDGRGGAWIGATDVESVPQGFPRTDMGWEVEPDGLRRLLLRLRDDYPAPPLYVTENGIALRDVVEPDGTVLDPARIAYLDGHLRSCRQAIDAGVDLRGYFVWTLTDNFEWAYGFSKKFGLVHLDPETQRRIPKSSARWFADAAKSNALPD